MRNEPKPLDKNLARYAAKVESILTEVSYRPVHLFYTKRDGSKSSSIGTVKFFNGAEGMDTRSVTIDTSDKGPRTINLHRIFKVD